MSFFKPAVNFSLNIASPFSLLRYITPLYFFNLNIICFGQKESIKVQILRLSSVGSKFAKFLISFFKA